MTDRCKNGHELTDANILINHKGHRRCRVCRREWTAARCGIKRQERAARPRICAQGHALVGDNIKTDRRGGTRCRTCAAAWHVKQRKTPLVCDRSVCGRGHALTPENVYKGTRECRTCALEMQRARRKRMREGMPARISRSGVDMQAMLVRLRDGAVVDDLAEENHVAASTFREWLRLEPEWRSVRGVRNRPGSPWPARDAELIGLRETCGPREIARRMGVSLGSISGRIHRLRQNDSIARRVVAIKPGPKPIKATATPPPRLVARSVVQPAPVYRAPAPPVSLPPTEKRGEPGVWRAPVALPWEAIQREAAAAGKTVATRDDLPGYSRWRVSQGWQPRAIARSA